MFLIIGLGNPGEKYKNTRHNIGFRVVKKFQKKNKFPEFRFSKKFKAQISEDKINNKKMILVKPQIFMNDSGKSVKKIMSNVKCQMSNVLIIHDDIDIPLGKIRISKSRGPAGHKGVESIIRELKTKDFVRLRIGIKPFSKTIKPFSHLAIETFVLQKFNKNEEGVINESIKKACLALGTIIREGLEKAMSEFNQ